MPSKSQSVAFRLNETKLRSLAGLAAVHGKSPGEYARDIVIEKLSGEDSGRQAIELLRTEVQELKAALADFREGFSVAVEALIVISSGKNPVPPEHAKRWVDEQIRRKPPTVAAH